MALSIGVSVGSKIIIHEGVAGVPPHVLEVKALTQPNLIVVSLDGGKDILVTDKARTEILPTVFVFAGIGHSGSGGSNRIAFEAPQSIRITRAEKEKRK